MTGGGKVVTQSGLEASSSLSAKAKVEEQAVHVPTTSAVDDVPRPRPGCFTRRRRLYDGGTAPNTVCVCEYVRGDRMPRRKYRRGWRRHGGARAGRGGGCARLATQDAAGQLAWIRELVAEHPPGTRAIGTMAWPPSPELNDECAFVIGFGAAKGRYMYRVRHEGNARTGKPIGAKPHNLILRQCPAVTAEGLDSGDRATVDNARISGAMPLTTGQFSQCTTFSQPRDRVLVDSTGTL